MGRGDNAVTRGSAKARPIAAHVPITRVRAHIRGLTGTRAAMGRGSNIERKINTVTTTIIQGGEAAIRHHRAQLVAELDATEQRATLLAARIRKMRARAELLQAAITADTAVLVRLAQSPVVTGKKASDAKGKEASR